MIKKYLNKKNVLYLILLITSFIVIFFSFNNYFLYNDPILKVNKVDRLVNYVGNNKEEYYIENITGIIKNGKYRGKEVSVINYSTYSMVYDDEINKGTELIVELSEDGENVISIINIKRDKYICILLVLFFDLMIIIGKKQGIKTLISLLINILISCYIIFIYQNNINKISILLLFIPVTIFFIIFSLICTNGINKKSFAAITSSIVSILISFLLSFILIKIYINKIPFWFMDYVDAIKDYENLFYVNILLCGIGAIMDISITMSSSINELIVKNNNILKKDLIKSGREISKDIVGSMINVMLFTMFTSIIPLSLLAVRNNMPMSSILNNYGEIEMIRVLTSCISIVLTIPIALNISILLLHKKEIKND